MLDPMEGVYEFGPFRLETRERRLLRDGRPVRLRGKVFDTLCVLVSRPGRLVEKDDLIAAVWPDTVVEENNLAHNINALRKALGDGALIETVPGKGYRFAGTALPGRGGSRTAHGGDPVRRTPADRTRTSR